MSSHLDAFLEGWRKGDAGMILRAVADDLLYDDPVDGRFAKSEFAAYLDGLFAAREGRSDGSAEEDFETITDLVIVEKDANETAWGWWKTATGVEGAGLVKAGPDGVHSEKVAYYTRVETS